MAAFVDGDDVFATTVSSASTAAFDGSGTNLAIFGFVGASTGAGSPTITGATWNGGTGDALAAAAAQLSFHTYLSARGFYKIGSQSDASATVTGTTSGTVDELYVYGGCASGVGSLGNVDSHADTASPGSWQATGASGIVMFGSYGGYGGFDPTITAGTGVVEDVTNVYNGGNGAYILQTTGDTISQSWIPSADDCGGVAVNFLDAGGGGGVFTNIVGGTGPGMALAGKGGLAA